jgi:hypothetical protein
MKPEKELNRIADRIKLLEMLLEAQQVEARNEADQSWITSAELRDRLAKRGVNVESSQ